MQPTRITVLMFVLISCGALAGAQTADERAAARDIVKKKGDAVVMIMATLKIRATVGGQEQTADQQAQGNGTVLDSSGLAVMSLSTLQPDDVMARNITARVQPGTKVDVSSEPSEIKMHFADGRELPAKLVLRDTDLDLAFLRPSETPASPLVAVDAQAAKPLLMDLLLVVQRTSETNGWATAAAFSSVQLVVNKPRTYYQMTGPMPLGAPFFDPTGRFVGVTVMRNPGARGVPPVIGVLPADDIRDVAKQVLAK
jgi:hypothetical protein